MGTKIKVLQVVGGMPNDKNPSLQPFVASQIESLRNTDLMVDVIDLSALGAVGYKKYLFGIAALRKSLLSHYYNIIHAHYSYCGWVARMQNRVPVVVSLMGSDLLGTPNVDGRQTLRGKFDSIVSRLLVRNVDHVIVKSAHMSRNIPGKTRVSVLPNGVDFEVFKPIPMNIARKHLEIDPLEKVILFAGNPSNPRKNFRLAKESFEHIQHNMGVPCRLLTFFGKSQEELAFAMNASDVLLMTSFQEGSPNIVKESMACNLPIVSVDVGDVSEVIATTRNCYLADYNSLSIANNVKKVLWSCERSDGRCHIRHLSLENVAHQIIDVYLQEINRYSALGR